MGYFIAKNSFVVVTSEGLKFHISSNGLSPKVNYSSYCVDKKLTFQDDLVLPL